MISTDVNTLTFSQSIDSLHALSPRANSHHAAASNSRVTMHVDWRQLSSLLLTAGTRLAIPTLQGAKTARKPEKSCLRGRKPLAKIRRRSRRSRSRASLSSRLSRYKAPSTKAPRTNWRKVDRAGPAGASLSSSEVCTCHSSASHSRRHSGRTLPGTSRLAARIRNRCALDGAGIRVTRPSLYAYFWSAAMSCSSG